MNKKNKILKIIAIICVALFSIFISNKFIDGEIPMRGNGYATKFQYYSVTFLVTCLFSALYFFKENKKFLYCAILLSVIPIMIIFTGNIFDSFSPIGLLILGVLAIYYIKEKYSFGRS